MVEHITLKLVDMMEVIVRSATSLSVNWEMILQFLTLEMEIAMNQFCRLSSVILMETIVTNATS